ncbi:MAG: NAD-dependent epimerase/dehydratase family protein [Gammaproteobacteria bacterium]|jgi:nucleoside-diphosphate-sugar epimerase
MVHENSQGRDNVRAQQAGEPRALIVGCGYLGTVTARMLVAAGREVWATTRSRERWQTLESVVARLIQYDISGAEAGGTLPTQADAGPWDVFVMLTPSAIAPTMDVGRGYDHLLDAIGTLKPRRAVLVSSTGVYGEPAGATVTAETPAQAAGDRGARLLGIEDRWLEAGARYRVCRLAGIYGPGRVIGRQAVLNGDALPGDPDAWLNLIHVEDAAELVLRCAAADNAQRIELGSDGEPVKRGAYYAHLASLLGAQAPRFERKYRARSASKRCDPGSTMERLGWAPRYRGYRHGLADSIGADDINL